MALLKDALFNADRLHARLREAPSPLPVFRETLQRGREQLKQRYLEKPNETRDLVTLHAWLVDQLLKTVWRFYREKIPHTTRMALVAVGGYGRGELHPHSDVDLLLLLEKGDVESVRGFVEGAIQLLWDMGLQIGHSVRTLKDCVAEAKKDLTILTNMMESRLLIGDETLFTRMRESIAPTKIWPSKKFFEGKLAEQRARHHRFHDTAYNLEPNVKEGPGGLRDIQTIAWVTQRQFDTTSLHDLVPRGFLSEEEYRTLIRGRHFLWKVRDGLHHLAGRREDRLVFDHQRALAKHFGYRDRAGALAVEQFMKRYYRTIKELSLLNEILLQHFEEVLFKPAKGRIVSLNRRFQSRNGYLEIKHAKVFERFPFALLELFLTMQQHELKGVRADTIRLVRANLKRIDAKFRKDLACRALFMEILRQKKGITHELRRMNAYGVLGEYLPVFGRVVGQMQHDLFHVYTVDEHTLFVVRNLRRLTVPEYRKELPFASELIKKVFKPERLYLAGLFHDIAKGRGGDHSELGEHDAIVFCKQHGLSDYDARFIAWLVRYHLIFSSTAQREDITDPDVVLRFAQKVGDLERLDNLYLLTVADMRATSPAVWNAWKGRLLNQLHASATQVLRRGLATPLDADAHLADLKTGALAQLKRSRVNVDAVLRFWENLDNDYFLRHEAESLAWHAKTIAEVPMADLPIVATRYTEDLGGSEFLFYVPDREDLFVIMTAGFERLNLSIVDARIHTLKNGFALDTFVVLGAQNEPITDARELVQLQRQMRDQMIGPKPGRDLLGSRLPRQLQHFPIVTRVQFSASANKPLTIMEVTAQDRPGLLHQVALALKHCRVNLVTAKIATYGERAEDVFFLNAQGGKPLLDEAQMKCLEQEIIRRLEATAPDHAKENAA
jgi:[protein-PII] uridylyltransferase